MSSSTKRIRAFRKAGLTVEHTRGSHLKLILPGGGVYFTGSTPGDVRAWHRLRRDLRRMGFEGLPKNPP